MELGATVAKALLASAKGTEVLRGLGGDIVVEVEIDTASLICDGVRHRSDAVMPAGLKDLIQWQKAGQQCCLTFDFLRWT